jgi:hypothetical protein
MTELSIEQYLRFCFIHKLYLRRSWRASVLTQALEYKNVSPFYIYPIDSRYGFTHKDGSVYVIKDTDNKKPLLTTGTKLKISKIDLPNLNDTIETEYGIYIINILAFIDQFGVNAPYINKPIVSKDLHRAYIELNEKGVVKHGKQITVSCQNIELATIDIDIVTPAASYKTFTSHKDMDKVRSKLLNTYKDELNNPVVEANIDKELKELDKEYLKDDVSEKFFLPGIEEKRKKLFLTYGSEPGMDGKPTNYIEEKLDSGLDIGKDMVGTVNVARSGSYSRGSLTALSGVDTKTSTRMYSSLSVDGDDCGTTKGVTVNVNDKNYSIFTGMHLLSTNKPLTEKDLLGHVGSSITIRSPGYCKRSKVNYCKSCSGTTVSRKPNAVSGGVAGIDSNLMLVRMKQAHHKAKKNVKINLDNAFV